MKTEKTYLELPISGEIIFGKKGEIISEKFQIARVELTKERFEVFCRTSGFDLEAENLRQIEELNKEHEKQQKKGG